SESYDNLKTDLNEFISAFKIKKGQTGVVIIMNGEIKGFEVFLNSDVYSQYHEKILKSYLIDTDINDSVFPINIDEAKTVMANALDSELNEAENIGLEKRFELKSNEGIGTLYTHEDELIHCSFFAVDEISKDADETQDMSEDEWTGQTIVF
ncbi:MAG: hypothetical protein IKV88_08130, partial [Clostridia bacterium]|nr:hypothetical protein [Clostridia bacterium]